MKKLIALLIVAAPALAFASPNTTDLDAIKTQEAKCLETGTSTVGMKMCESELYQSADKILNADYQKMVGPLKSDKSDYSKEILRRLVASQRAWVTFRDANCQYQGTWDLGGTAEGLDILSCLAEMTIARVKELRPNL